VKAALDKLEARKRAAENRIELKRRLLAHTLQQIGLKTLRTPTAITLAEASLKAIAIAPEDIPARWWKPQPPKLDQDGLTKAIRTLSRVIRAQPRGRLDTPRPLRSSRTPAYRDRIPWQRLHLFWGDERCVPPDHPDSNYGMVHATVGHALG
jgi:hypothetical protein